MIALMTVILKLEMPQVNILPHLLGSELSHFWFMAARLVSSGRQNGVSGLLELRATSSSVTQWDNWEFLCCE